MLQYDDYQEHRDKDENISKALDAVDERMSKISFNIVAIRSNGINEQAKATSCAADIQFQNGKSHDIEYQAPLTSDDQIYVEVFGL
jgi:recombinational DNA repair ATPase RecF